MYSAALIAELKRQGRIKIAGNRAYLLASLPRVRTKNTARREQTELFELLTSIAIGWDRESVVRAVSLRAADRLESRLLQERAQSILDGAVLAIQSLGAASVLRGKTRKKSRILGEQFLVLSLTRNLKRSGSING